MYARLISFSGADSGKRDAAVEMIRGTVIPMLRNYDGYAGYISLYDEANQRAKAIILWETKEASFSGGRLRIDGLLGDTVSEPIQHGRVVIRGILFDDEYDYSPTCSAASAPFSCSRL